MTHPLDQYREAVARALAHSDGLDWDEMCGLSADPINGECDSGTCVAAHYEDHDPDYARAIYLQQADAAIRAMMPAFEWRAMDSAPRDEEILAAILVKSLSGHSWWERHVIVIDSETDTIRDMDYHHGWEADDYLFWLPLPSAPTEGRE